MQADEVSEKKLCSSAIDYPTSSEVLVVFQSGREIWKTNALGHIQFLVACCPLTTYEDQWDWKWQNRFEMFR